MKKQIKSIPSHYRRLRTNEDYQYGDLFRSFSTVDRCNGAGEVASWPGYMFFRRRHVKVKKVHPVEKNPLVKFFYPHKDGPATHRVVRLIGANAQYIVGLQVNDKNRFKKFSRSKVQNLSLVEFSPLSVS